MAATVSILAIVFASCIKPEQEADLFGTEGSTVTGSDDDSDDDHSDDDDDDDGRDDGKSKADARAEEADDDDSPEGTDPGEDDDSADEPSDDDATEPPDEPSLDAGSGGTRDAGAPRDAAVRPTADARTPTEPPPADAGSTAPPDAGAPPQSGPAPTKLSFSVTTVTARGRYAPRHVLAVWVADAQGKFVKTLAKHALIRGRWLTGWNAAAGGNVVDAVTGATLSSHGTRNLTWNLTNAQKMPVPDGEYKIMMEFTEADRTGVSHSVSFTKGPSGVRMMPPDSANFTKMSIALE